MLHKIEREKCTLKGGPVAFRNVLLSLVTFEFFLTQNFGLSSSLYVCGSKFQDIIPPRSSFSLQAAVLCLRLSLGISQVLKNLVFSHLYSRAFSFGNLAWA